MSVIVDTTSLCQSFPILRDPLVPREHILETIDLTFAGNESISVEGQEGIGKTSVLALFARSRPERCLSVFIKPSSRWAYDPTVLILELICQAEWILSHEVLTPEALAPDTARLRTALYKIGVKGSRNKTPYYILVDGLTDIPKDESQAIESIIDLLPIGNPRFRFLFSGDVSALATLRPLVAKSLPLSPFTLEESVTFIGDLVPDRSHLRELHLSCQGIPGHLASVRRLLESGVAVEDLIRDIPSDLSSMFQLEWDRIPISEHWHQELLAIIAHDPRTRTIDDFGRILSQPCDEIARFISVTAVLQLGPGASVTYVSDLIRRVAESRLADLRTEAFALLIKDLAAQPNTREAATYLPAYYQAIDRVDDLLNCLSPTHFATTLKCTESLGTVRNQADLGFITAVDAGRFWDSIRFVLQKGLFTDAAGSGPTESEIRAHVALGLSDSAIALARGAATKEKRFRGLAVALSSKTGVVANDAELVRELRQLYSEIDINALGENAIDIGIALISVVPDMALEIVDRSARDDGDSHARDVALVRLALQLGDAPSNSGESDLLSRIQDRISNPRLLSLSKAASWLRRAGTAAEVLAQVGSLESSQDRLAVLRLWLNQNRHRSDSLTVDRKSVV